MTMTNSRLFEVHEARLRPRDALFLPALLLLSEKMLLDLLLSCTATSPLLVLGRPFLGHVLRRLHVGTCGTTILRQEYHMSATAAIQNMVPELRLPGIPTRCTQGMKNAWAGLYEKLEPRRARSSDEPSGTKTPLQRHVSLAAFFSLGGWHVPTPPASAQAHVCTWNRC